MPPASRGMRTRTPPVRGRNRIHAWGDEAGSLGAKAGCLKPNRRRVLSRNSSFEDGRELRGIEVAARDHAHDRALGQRDARAARPASPRGPPAPRRATRRPRPRRRRAPASPACGSPPATSSSVHDARAREQRRARAATSRRARARPPMPSTKLGAVLDRARRAGGERGRERRRGLDLAARTPGAPSPAARSAAAMPHDSPPPPYGTSTARRRRAGPRGSRVRSSRCRRSRPGRSPGGRRARRARRSGARPAPATSARTAPARCARRAARSRRAWPRGA